MEGTDQLSMEERSVVEQGVAHEVTQRLQEVQALMQELLGNSFSSRFRWIAEQKRWRLHTDIEEGQRRRYKQIEGLVQEAIAKPTLMDTEWEWLFHQQETFPEEFAEVLGRLDENRLFASKMNGLAETNLGAIGWASRYEIANAEVNGSPERVDSLTDQLRAVPDQGARVFDLLLRTGYSPKRLEILKELFSTGAIEASRFDQLTWSRWRDALTPSQVIDLLKTLQQQGAKISSLISFLETYLHTQPAALEDLREIAIDLLWQGEETDRNVRTMHGYHWEELAKRLVEANPYEIAKAVLAEIGRRQSSTQPGPVELLQTAWRLTEKGKLFREAVAPWLEMETTEAWWVRRAIRQALPLDQVGVEALAHWVSKRPEVRASRLAEIIGAPLGQPSDAHAMLLERFGDEVDGVFYGAFISGTWWGPASIRTRGKLEEAKTWLDDERPAIREWAKNVVRDLEATLERDIKSEEEERFR